jgi:hypothetical protein
MQFRIWYSTEGFAEYIVNHTILRGKKCSLRKMYESDANNANNFHTMPDHIKQILYLDAPDIIVEMDSEPIFSVEISQEAGTGHNVFQRFARLAASVENDVPAFYIYPEAVIVRRQEGTRWDQLNPLIFHVLDKVMNIYGIPALFYYFPSDYRNHETDPEQSPHRETKGLKLEEDPLFAECPLHTDVEMQRMFEAMDEIILTNEKHGVVRARSKMLANRVIQDRRDFMNREFYNRGGGTGTSPLTATETVDTGLLINTLSDYEVDGYRIGELLRSRPKTVIYKVDAAFRGDPYPGALAAIDYAVCREGKTFEERRHNLVMAWGEVESKGSGRIGIASSRSSITDFFTNVRASESKNLLNKHWHQLRGRQIPRYYMQVRYGSMFSKVKHIRVYSYFADAILFHDGALWRDA